MLKHMKKFICILAALTVGLSMTAFAEDAAIRYEGGADKFVMDADGTELKDLFLNFKDVMPGDTLTQKILLKNARSNRFNARISMRSLGGTTESEKAFLSQMNLKVTEGDSDLLSSDLSDKPAGLTEWKVLGTVTPGSEIVLNVELTVPLTMGNEFQNSLGKIDWEFKVEEIPRGGGGDHDGGGGGDGGGNPSGGGSVSEGPGVTTDTPGEGPAVTPGENAPGGELFPISVIPKTGDAANLILWIALAVLSGGGLAVLLYKGRRRDKDA